MDSRAASDVVSLIDQYELIPVDHAEAIVEALKRKGHHVTLELFPVGGWTLDDVAEGQLWERDNAVYRVIEISRKPTVTLRNLTGDDETPTFEIRSQEFRKFTRLRRVWSDGSADV